MHWTVVEKVQLSNKKTKHATFNLVLFLRINAVFQNAEGQNWEVQKTNIAKKSVKPNQRKATKTNRKEGRKEAESRKKSKITCDKNTKLPSCARKKEIRPFNL